ncbi:MAG: hypothetical protein IKD18_03500 [Clostridia bacterium]|nr:hypothetical protein [Clostridia bacterium]
MKQKFRAFRWRLLLENALLGSLAGLSAGGVGVFVLALIDRILIRRTSADLAWLVGGGLGALAFLSVFALLFPTRRRIAKRMDEMGLKERVRTMLALEKETTPLAELQRQDTQKALDSVKAGKMKLRLPKRLPLVCAVSLALALVMLLVPYDVFAYRPDLGEENRAFLEELMAELREELLKEELGEELLEELEEILDQLEEDLKSSESQLEQAAKIEEAKKKIEEKMEEALTKDPIGEALQHYELTKPLGEAIVEADEEKVRAVMEGLEKAILEDPSLAEELATTVDLALGEVEVPEEDALRTALAGLALDLHENNPDDPSFKTKLNEDMEKATISIIVALRQQMETEEVKKKAGKKMEEAKKEALGMKEKQEAEETATEGGGKEESETQTGEGETPKETQEGKKPPKEESKKPGPQGGNGESKDPNGGGGSTPFEMSEEIYDPYSGTVPYGKVFALYYAEYLAAQERGEVTDEMRAVLDRYFSQLNG